MEQLFILSGKKAFLRASDSSITFGGIAYRACGIENVILACETSSKNRFLVNKISDKKLKKF